MTGLHPSVERAVRFDTPSGTFNWFSTGGRLIILVCDSPIEPPPDDRWLSIAETFEFVPAEEKPERSVPDP